MWSCEDSKLSNTPSDISVSSNRVESCWAASIPETPLLSLPEISHDTWTNATGTNKSKHQHENTKRKIKILVGVFGFPGCHQEEDAEECWRIRQRGYDLNRTSSQIPSSAIRIKSSYTKIRVCSIVSLSLSLCLPGCFLQSGLWHSILSWLLVIANAVRNVLYGSKLVKLMSNCPQSKPSH